MKRTTVSLPDELAAATQMEARRRGVSVSEVTRDALAEHLGLTGETARHIPFAAIGASGKRNTSRDAEKILAREWGRARDR